MGNFQAAYYYVDGGLFAMGVVITGIARARAAEDFAGELILGGSEPLRNSVHRKP